jgi:hypothetical protein
VLFCLSCVDFFPLVIQLFQPGPDTPSNIRSLLFCWFFLPSFSLSVVSSESPPTVIFHISTFIASIYFPRSSVASSIFVFILSGLCSSSSAKGVVYCIQCINLQFLVLDSLLVLIKVELVFFVFGAVLAILTVSP